MHTFADLAKVLNRSTVYLSRLAPRCKLPTFYCAGYSEGYREHHGHHRHDQRIYRRRGGFRPQQHLADRDAPCTSRAARFVTDVPETVPPSAAALRYVEDAWRTVVRPLADPGQISGMESASPPLAAKGIAGLLACAGAGFRH